MSDDAVLNTDGVDFTSPFVSFTASGLRVAAADAVTGALVVAGMYSDGTFLSEVSK
jgi:hypothetical protein